MKGIIILLIYGLGFAGVIAVGAMLYMRSVASRRQHTCRKCGEKITVELMKANHCNVCGSPFEEN